MFISPAYAQSAGGGFGGMESLLPLVLIFVVFYFLLIRPQQKKQKTHREMLEALRRGDRIVTAGGIVGTITKASETELTVEIAEGIKVKVMRGMISDVLAKTEARDAANDDDSDEKDDNEKDEKDGK
jgi:preprotein translocase subunit YajC